MFLVAGDVFGFEEGLRQFSAEALTEVVAFRHRQPVTEDLQPLDANGVQPVQRALEATERNLRLFSQPNACRRIGLFLLDFAQRCQSGNLIELPMSRQDLADHLGLTMHTVSRSISGLTKQGMLIAENPANLRIADRTAFEEFVGVDWIEPPPGQLRVA